MTSSTTQYFEADTECPFCNRDGRLRFKRMHPIVPNVRMMKCGSCDEIFYMKMKDKHVMTKA